MCAERRLTIEEIDKNMAINSKINKEGLKFFSMYDEPFVIFGGLKKGDDGRLYRVPKEVAEKTSRGVLGLCTNTAGGRVRFKTDSKRVAIVAKYSNTTYMSHFAITGSVGLDLYADDDFIGEFRPPLSMPQSCYESVLTIKAERKERNVTINLPIYSDLIELYVGLDEDATLSAPTPYTYEKPIVYYGSSVTQGGCASKPSDDYINRLSAWLDSDVFNLGFSGSARGEQTMADYIAAQDPSVFVMDYDYNAPDAAHLKRTHYPLYKTIRTANPTTPIVFLTMPTFEGRTQKDRFAVIEETYRRAKEEGDENVYFVSGDGSVGHAGGEQLVILRHLAVDVGFDRKRRIYAAHAHHREDP